MSLRAAVLVIILLAAADQGVKALVERAMDLGEMIPLVPFFALLRAHNEGVAFSLFSGFDHQVLIAVTALITAGAAWMLARTPAADAASRIGLAAIIGGAIGNLIDRVQHSYVIDYFLFHTPGWSFAIFNLADVFITLGAGLVILDEFVLKPRRAARDAG